MDQELYTSLASRASELVDAGQRSQAIEILETLVRSDLPDFDRAMMCMNIAIVCDQMEKHFEALDAYSRAVDIASTTGSYFIEQHRAAYYSKLGLYDESIKAYEALLRHDNLSPEDRDAFLQNIAALSHLRESG